MTVRNARHGTSSRGAKGEPQNPRLSLSPLVLWRGFKHLTQITWPRRFAIVQFPNAPLIIALIAGETAKHTHGTSAAYASSVSYLAFAIWAYLELVEGRELVPTPPWPGGRDLRNRASRLGAAQLKVA
jgi:hypothetical protein